MLYLKQASKLTRLEETMTNNAATPIPIRYGYIGTQLAVFNRKTGERLCWAEAIYSPDGDCAYCGYQHNHAGSHGNWQY